MKLDATFWRPDANSILMNVEPEWNIVVEEIGPELYRFFLGSFAAQTASDLVQETLIRLVQKQRDGDFQADKGTLRSYAFGIARFVRLEFLKKKPDHELVDDESILDTAPAETNAGSDQVAHLRWAIRQLKPIEQELILQMIDEESSFEQIAKNYNMPLGTVKSHIHRAKEKLRAIMEAKNAK